MRDEDGRLAAAHVLEVLKHLEFRPCIQGGRGLVEDQNLRVAHIGPGDRDLLPFAAGEVDAVLEALADHLIEAFWKLRDHAICAAACGRFFDAFGAR